MPRHEDPAVVRGQPPPKAVDGAVEHLHIKIPLKPQDKPAVLPVSFVEALKEEYAIKYLQRLGAQPTADNIAAVLRHLPLDECHIATAWKSRGSLADVVMIDLYPHPRPGMVAANVAESNAIVPRRPRRPLGADDEALLMTHKPYQIGGVCLSFEDMKRQYLLPFKHGHNREPDVLSQFGMKHDEPLTFVDIPALSQSHGAAHLRLLGRRASQRRIKCIEERATTPDARPELIRQMLRAFFGCLPFAALGIRTEQERERLAESLNDDSMVQLVEVLVRYLYLEVFFKLACLGVGDVLSPSAISAYEKTAPMEIETCYVTIVRLFGRRKQQMEREERGITLHLPLQLLAIRVAVDTIFRCSYPVSFGTTSPTMVYVMKQVDNQITKLLDPDEHLSRIGILETTCESSKVMASQPYQIKRRQDRLRDQYYQTSAALHTIFPNPLPGRCRKILKLKGGASIAHYPVPLPTEEAASPMAGPPTEAIGGQRATGHDSRSVSLETRLKLLRLMERSARVAVEPHASPRSRKCQTARD